MALLRLAWNVVRGKGAQQVPPLRCAPVGMTNVGRSSQRESVSGGKNCTPSAKRAVHSIQITTVTERTNLPFVIPSELRISYYAVLKNDHVCGFL
jgi:hypothetical protein